MVMQCPRMRVLGHEIDRVPQKNGPKRNASPIMPTGAILWTGNDARRHCLVIARGKLRSMREACAVKA